MEKIMMDVIDLAVKAGEMVLCDSGFKVDSKGTKENYVTSTDIKVQEYLRRELSKILPGSYFMGEEGTFRPRTTDSGAATPGYG